jgi:amino acid transporter
MEEGVVQDVTAVQRGGEFYTRQATGLVREMSVRDMFVMTVVYISIIFGLLTISIIPFAFPGANIPLSILLTGVIALFPVLLYAFFTAAMPRTGGDFIFVGRVLHPVLGFMANWNMTVWVIFFQAIQGGWVVGTGFSSLFFALSITTGSSTLLDFATTLQHPWPRFIGSMIVLAIIGFGLARGFRSLMRVTYVLFILMLIGLGAGIITALLTSQGQLDSSLAHYHTSIAALSAAAQHSGYSIHTGFSWVATLASFPLMWAVLGFSQVSAYTAGEIRSPRRNALVAMVGSVVFATIVFAVTGWAVSNFAGNDFIGAMEHLFQTASAAYPFPIEPTVYLYPTITHGTILAILIWSAFIIGGFLTIPASLLVVTRNVFAWSFDRILPTSLASVDDKYHAPRNAVIAVVLLVAVCSAVFIFGPSNFTTFAFSGSAGQMLTFILVAMAGIVFAYRRKDLHDSSPYHGRILGVPVFTWLGVISLAMFISYFILLMTNSALGANAAVGIWSIVAIMALGGIVYLVSYLVNRSRGIDLLMGQRELPPE